MRGREKRRGGVYPKAPTNGQPQALPSSLLHYEFIHALEAIPYLHAVHVNGEAHRTKLRGGESGILGDETSRRPLTPRSPGPHATEARFGKPGTIW